MKSWTKSDWGIAVTCVVLWTIYFILAAEVI